MVFSEKCSNFLCNLVLKNKHILDSFTQYLDTLVSVFSSDDQQTYTKLIHTIFVERCFDFLYNCEMSLADCLSWHV